jgi:EmrB/QacA subfamily drug resistance transporter
MHEETAVAPAHAALDPHVYQRRWAILAVLCLSLVLVVATVSSVNVAIPSLAVELGPTDTQILWIVDAYALVFAGLLLPCGALGDRFGRKGALLLGLAIFASASVACSRTTAPEALIACRAIMGMGAAFIMPSTLSLLITSFPPDERAKAIAIWAGFAGAGGAIGPIMGGWLLEHFWYGSVFFVSVPIAIAAFIGTALLVPTSRDAEATPLDPAGGAMSAVGFSALVFAIIEGPEVGWTDPLVIAGAALAVAALVGFVLWERRSAQPMLDMAYFRRPRFAMGSLGVTVTFLAMFSLFFVITQYFQYVRDLDPLAAGVRGLPFAITMIIVSPRSATLAGRLGARPVVVGGLGLLVAGLVGMSFLGQTTPYVWIALLLVVMAAGVGSAMPSLTAGIMQSVPMSKAGVGSAVNDTTREVGGAVGIALIGSIVTSVYRDQLAPALEGLPAPLAEQAAKNVGRAKLVAADQPALMVEVKDAFVQGMHVGLRVSAAIVVVAAVVLTWRLPRKGEAGA